MEIFLKQSMLKEPLFFLKKHRNYTDALTRKHTTTRRISYIRLSIDFVKKHGLIIWNSF